MGFLGLGVEVKKRTERSGSETADFLTAFYTLLHFDDLMIAIFYFIFNFRVNFNYLIEIGPDN